jgi:hypothetical protein
MMVMIRATKHPSPETDPRPPAPFRHRQVLHALPARVSAPTIHSVSAFICSTVPCPWTGNGSQPAE